MVKDEITKTWRKPQKPYTIAAQPEGAASRRRDERGDDSGWMRSGAVAARLGLKTGTLRKWRTEGRGPAGWRRVSPTCVMYPVSGVLEFEASWRMKGE